ncbi:hypothetical protein OPV22_031322 [Ensete ventricosum]|uniref:Uncharacterized protein n=1 Tax=Ensete ventricosum TaxID=4639 RepID=A0AAV8NZ81_ENSVE|nr:hypothetical protein OPV22_031322 [Ensete ventricosum]
MAKLKGTEATFHMFLFPFYFFYIDLPSNIDHDKGLSLWNHGLLHLKQWRSFKLYLHREDCVNIHSPCIEKHSDDLSSPNPALVYDYHMLC